MPDVVRGLLCALGMILTTVSSSVTAQSFQAVTDMKFAHIGHTATLLPDGTVLVAGEFPELYDPQTGAFRLTGAPIVDRFDHTATTLSDGTVLIVGGNDTRGATLSSCEIYDPRTGRFAVTGSMARTRRKHTAVRLLDGRVLAVGGLRRSASGGDVPEASTEFYDPATGTWRDGPAMTEPRYQLTATSLANGKVLMTGGGPTAPFTGFSGQILTSAEVYDPVSGVFHAVGSMAFQHWQHTATPLADGRVLVVGDHYEEIYNPATEKFTTAGRTSDAARYDHTATLMFNGDVLIAGGGVQPYDSSSLAPMSSAEVFSVAREGTDTPSLRTADMTIGRSGAAATVLTDGTVLVTGGNSGPIGTFTALARAEIYRPALLPTCSPPRFVDQPSTLTVPKGKPGLISVTVVGSMPYSYQWYEGASGDQSRPVLNALASSLQTAAVISEARYWVRITNACGAVQSATITLEPGVFSSRRRAVRH